MLVRLSPSPRRGEAWETDLADYRKAVILCPFPAEVRTLELKLARADADVVTLLLLGVKAAEAVDDHRALDGEAEGVLRGERECLAGVDHRGDGGAADGVWHGLLERFRLLDRRIAISEDYYSECLPNCRP
jgi:hypothetical protein